MRNQSAEVLRRVGHGETIVVTNHGQPAAVIGPPPADLLTHLSAQGQVREALESPATLLSVPPKKASRTTAQVIADVRGDW